MTRPDKTPTVGDLILSQRNRIAELEREVAEAVRLLGKCCLTIMTQQEMNQLSTDAHAFIARNSK